MYLTVDSATGAADGRGAGVPDEAGVPHLPRRRGQVSARTRPKGGRAWGAATYGLNVQCRDLHHTSGDIWCDYHTNSIHAQMLNPVARFLQRWTNTDKRVHGNATIPFSVHNINVTFYYYCTEIKIVKFKYHINDHFSVLFFRDNIWQAMLCKSKTERPH